ncbi:hypothetical protein PanWU01x14_071320 [Parasponia andersonii]|uniref:Uncharacterized protein n=1 Tax=Parasponia andersonii TaxID=3476 RepID=A0A2P5DEH5_PARAD|nr:hypothetical protein PanWU01x14_071320 [Parasponia andersonii]
MPLPILQPVEDNNIVANQSLNETEVVSPTSIVIVVVEAVKVVVITTNPSTKCAKKMGHTTAICSFFYDKNFQPPQSNPMSTFVAAPKTATNPNWYVDSGATNYVTNNTKNLNTKIDYNSFEKLTIGNGQDIDIHHIIHGLLFFSQKTLLEKCPPCPFHN